MRKFNDKSAPAGITAARVVMVVTLLVLQGVDASTHATLLFDQLFTNYQSGVRPYCGNNNATSVRLDLALRQIVDLDEPSQILTLNLWVRMFWTDCQLTWDPTAYGGLGNIVVPFKYVWVPDLTLYDSTADDFPGYDDYRLNIYSDGSVYYNFPTITQSRCLVDVESFPYDTQTCGMTFGSWSHHGLEMDLVYKNPYGDLTSSVVNVEWNITGFTAERNVVYYGCCPEPYPDVTYYLKMKRKPAFYVVNIIIPSFLITGMAIIGFFLPVESGEKVSLQITVMLALAVFQLLVADSLPPSADATPLIAIYFNFCLFLVGFACVMSVVTLTIHYQQQQTMRRWVDKIFLRVLSKFTWVYVPELQEDSKEEDESTTQNDASSLTQVNGVTTTRVTVRPVSSKIGTEVCKSKMKPFIDVTEDHWIALAKVVDRLACITFVLMAFCGTGIVFSKFNSD
ncbi:neuronal acetylcholine receptor subunit alpha-9-like [Ylistrum balloti]|uniref:neuronal acetylcholine receptor subunit alpha-9-like n=1 Tax=Ylistrum balloti TaxID=509963 RepID=UPI002905F1D7|nr:neuronal acetylcholine receptor subunit alpha-9-like [Ylistrum balloti]